MSKLNIDILADAVKNMSEDEFVGDERFDCRLYNCEECELKESVCNEIACKRMFYRFYNQKYRVVDDE